MISSSQCVAMIRSQYDVTIGLSFVELMKIFPTRFRENTRPINGTRRARVTTAQLLEEGSLKTLTLA